jgi:nitroimidazol reductase NimA-like FMN-containing flavoprotein (pyridoxamine 5'-phosphate oxidase superfamily)
MSSLRRVDKEITDPSEVEDVLREAAVGRLATCADGKPYVVPLSYVYEGGKIFFHGAGQGKKMRDLAKNSRVCFEVDISELMPADAPCDYNFRYRSVIAEGAARVIQNPEEKLKALRLLIEKYAPGKAGKLTPERLFSFKSLAVVEIKIEEMTGKRSPAD